MFPVTATQILVLKRTNELIRHVGQIVYFQVRAFPAFFGGDGQRFFVFGFCFFGLVWVFWEVVCLLIFEVVVRHCSWKVLGGYLVAFILVLFVC